MTQSSQFASLMAGMIGSAIGLVLGAAGFAALVGSGTLSLSPNNAERTQTLPATIPAAEGLANPHQPTVSEPNRLDILERRQKNLAASVERLLAEVSSLQASTVPPTLESAVSESALSDTKQADLESLVLGIIERERQARAEDRRHLERERSADAAMLSEGPYGAHNYRVNRMSRELGLSPDQEAAYYELVARYTEEHQALSSHVQQQLAWDGTPSDDTQHSIHRFLTTVAELDAELHEELAGLLDDDQRRRFEDLPPDERSIGGPVVFADSDFPP